MERLGEREAEGDTDDLVHGQVEEVVFQLLESLPIEPRVGILLGYLLPSDIRNRAFCDDAHVRGFGLRECEVDGLLIGDVDRGLEAVEGATLYGVDGVV